MWKLEAVLILALISTAMLSDAQDLADMDVGAILAEDNSETTVNETAYAALMEDAWNEYTVDFLYASNLLQRYVNNSTSNERAMITAVSLYTLNSRNLNTLKGIKPPEEYASYHDYTVKTLYYFNEYLLDLAKYYETMDPIYAAEGLQNYNLTTLNRDKALEEMVLF